MTRKRGGRSPKRRGNELEYELRNILRRANIPARRVPQSGSSPDSPGDLLICTNHRLDEHEDMDQAGFPYQCSEVQWEAKGRRDGFRQLYAWLEGSRALAVRANRREWLLVVRLRDWIEERR